MPRKGQDQQHDPAWNKRVTIKQAALLNEEFNKNSNPTIEEMVEIGVRVGFRADQFYKVKNWFQNRRSKASRDRRLSETSLNSEAPKQEEQEDANQSEATLSDVDQLDEERQFVTQDEDQKPIGEAQDEYMVKTQEEQEVTVADGLRSMEENEGEFKNHVVMREENEENGVKNEAVENEHLEEAVANEESTVSQPRQRKRKRDDAPRKQHARFTPEQYLLLEDCFCLNPTRLLSHAQLAEIGQKVGSTEYKQIKTWFHNAYYNWLKGKRPKLAARIKKLQGHDGHEENQNHQGVSSTNIENLDAAITVSASQLTEILAEGQYVSDSGGEFEVEKILDFKRIEDRFELLVKWKGFSDAWNSWELTQSLPFNQVIEHFVQSNVSLFNH
jgi:hypothetical protein